MPKMLVCGALAMVMACGGGQKGAQEPAKPAISNKAPADPPPTQPVTVYEQGLVAMQKFRDQFCACTDANCATRVSDDMTKWAQETSKQWGDDHPKLSDEQTKQLQQIGEQMGQCMTKAMSNNQPTSGGGGNPCGAPP